MWTTLTTADLIKSRVGDETLRILDCRHQLTNPEYGPQQYAAGHIPGALSVPLAELKQRIRELPRQREIVAYCRGPYCVLAVEAVDMLRRKGFKAIRLEEGVPDWRARGLPVEVTGAGSSRGQTRERRA